MKRNKLFFGIHKIIIWGIIPILLTLGAVVTSLIYYREVSYSTLQYQHPIASIQFPKGDELIPGNTIHGEFIARENNLGALGIKVTTFNRINNSAIAFRLREKGKIDWYCYNTYFTDRFPNDEYYPFGFPVINDSFGKTYEFELLAGSGESGNAIGIRKNTNAFVSRYTFNKQKIVSNNKILISFLEKKSVNLITNVNYLLFLAIFFVPLVLYFLVVVGWKNIQKGNKNSFYHYALLMFVLTVYIVYPVLMKTNIVLFIALLILFISLIYKIAYQRLFTVAAILIFFCPLWLYIQKEEMANRSTVLVFFLMVDGMILLVKELYIRKKMKKV